MYILQCVDIILIPIRFKKIGIQTIRIESKTNTQ